jgi:hypothetical protein
MSIPTPMVSAAPAAANGMAMVESVQGGATLHPTSPTPMGVVIRHCQQGDSMFILCFLELAGIVVLPGKKSRMSSQDSSMEPTGFVMPPG